MSLGKDPATGKYRTVSKTVHGSYRQAQEALRLWRYEEDAARRTSPLLCDWLERYVAQADVAESTRGTLGRSAKALAKELGQLRLCDLDAVTVGDAWRRLAARGLSRGWLLRLHSVLMCSLQYAVDASVLPSAPSLPAPTIGEPPRRREALTGQQVAALMDALRPDDRHHVAVALALLAGLRLAEASERLRWEDVDLEAATIHVRGTKTAASDAVVPIAPSLASILECAQEATGCHQGPVVGLPAESMGVWWRRHREALGLAGVPFHALRHTYITLLARAGVHPSVMQSLARHATMQTTMEIYTHVHLEEQRQAVQALGAHLGGTNSGTNEPEQTAR